ncbi:MAG TPA: hypothetical protein EYP07_12725 [Kiloniellaceae bacterium]|nr:hypothetical protein [Kiloniellaceae bacterium]
MAAVHGADPMVIVKSPPGAGKTFLAECACAVATDNPRMKVAIVTPNVAQAYDIVRRLTAYDLPRLIAMHAQHRQLPPDLVGRVVEQKGWNPAANAGPGILVGNVHVLAQHLSSLDTHEFDLLIIDEAYQLEASNLMTVCDLARRILMVGDPGQLPPVQPVDTANLEAAEHKMHRSAPDYVLDRFPRTPVYELPVTRRLSADTTAFVQPAFYWGLPFESVVLDQDRKLDFAVDGLVPVIDDALDAVAAGASIVAITLPGAPPLHAEVDHELADVSSRIVERFLLRQATWRGERCLRQEDIGCIDPRVVTGGAISRRLRELGLPNVVVDTVEKWQGLERPVMVVRHPLSTVGRPAPFDLEKGRWCVALSRHQLGCVVVARASVETVIADYLHRSDTAAAGAEDTVWQGFVAHRHIWGELERRGRIFAL